MSKRVMGLFDSSEKAVLALDELYNALFSEKQISVLMSDKTYGSSFNIDKDNTA
jgi:hypothetical protein